MYTLLTVTICYMFWRLRPRILQFPRNQLVFLAATEQQQGMSFLKVAGAQFCSELQCEGRRVFCLSPPVLFSLPKVDPPGNYLHHFGAAHKPLLHTAIPSRIGVLLIFKTVFPTAEMWLGGKRIRSEEPRLDKKKK